MSKILNDLPSNPIALRRSHKTKDGVLAPIRIPSARHDKELRRAQKRMRKGKLQANDSFELASIGMKQEHHRPWDGMPFRGNRFQRPGTFKKR